MANGLMSDRADKGGQSLLSRNLLPDGHGQHPLGVSGCPEAGEIRLKEIAVSLKYDSKDLLDWYREDLADIATMTDYEFTLTATDYLTYRDFYRGQDG